MSSEPHQHQEPKQCSLYFEPKQWSKRYAETFFTCSVINHHLQQQSSTASFVIELKAGSLNTWRVEKTTEQFEQLMKEVSKAEHIKRSLDETIQLTSHFSSRQPIVTLPDLPAKKWSLLSSDVSPDYLQQRTSDFNTFLHNLLGSTREMSTIPCVREFLQLDRTLEKEPELELMEDEEEAKAMEQATRD